MTTTEDNEARGAVEAIAGGLVTTEDTTARVFAVQSPSVCESGCGCRYGSDDPDRLDCACDGPCSMAGPAEWGCDPDLGGCGGDCPTCPTQSVEAEASA